MATPLLGNHVTRRGYALGLSDAEIAARAGMTRSHLNRIRNGRAVPRLDSALALARILGCRARELFYLRKPESRRPTRPHQGRTSAAAGR